MSPLKFNVTVVYLGAGAGAYKSPRAGDLVATQLADEPEDAKSGAAAAPTGSVTQPFSPPALQPSSPQAAGDGSEAGIPPSSPQADARLGREERESPKQGPAGFTFMGLGAADEEVRRLYY